MATYRIEKEQRKNNFDFLRIMIYAPYRRKLDELKSNFHTNSEAFLFLISKYPNRFNQLAMYKDSSKKKYQEVTNQYENIDIRISKGVH